MHTMIVLTIVLSIFLLSAQGTKAKDLGQQGGDDVNAYDLEEEVREQLQELKASTRGQIFTAYREVDVFARDVTFYRNDRIEEAKLAIQQELELINEEIANLEILAQSAGQNPDVCLQDNQPQLQQLSSDTSESLRECLVLANVEVTTISNDAYYKIGTLMTEVTVFDYELDICAGEILCILPLVQQMELAKVRIPEKIEIEVQVTSGLIDNLKVLIKECTDSKVVLFNLEGGIIFNKISTCVNDLLS